MLRMGVLCSRDGVRRGGRCWVRKLHGFCRRVRSSTPRLATRPVHGEFGWPKKICPRACVWRRRVSQPWMVGLEGPLRFGSRGWKIPASFGGALRMKCSRPAGWFCQIPPPSRIALRRSFPAASSAFIALRDTNGMGLSHSDMLVTATIARVWKQKVEFSCALAPHKQSSQRSKTADERAENMHPVSQRNNLHHCHVPKCSLPRGGLLQVLRVMGAPACRTAIPVDQSRQGPSSAGQQRRCR